MTRSHNEVDGAGQPFRLRRIDLDAECSSQGADGQGGSEGSLLDLALENAGIEFSPGWTTLDLSRALQTEDPNTPELFVDVDRHLDRTSAEELRRRRTDAAA